MCRHCEKLIEDKDAVHQFMGLTVKRVNKKITTDGITLAQPVTADDIDIRVEVNARIWQASRMAHTEASGRIQRMLRDMNV